MNDDTVLVHDGPWTDGAVKCNLRVWRIWGDSTVDLIWDLEPPLTVEEIIRRVRRAFDTGGLSRGERDFEVVGIAYGQQFRCLSESPARSYFRDDPWDSLVEVAECYLIPLDEFLPAGLR